MAGFLDYGAGKGLAVAHDWGKDTQNLFQSEALKARDQQEKEQKTAFYAKQLQEGKTVAPANTQRLQDFYVQHNKKVADFVIKNPNFETDVTKMTEFMGLTDQYLNNDIIREDQQVQGEFSKLKSAAANGKLRPEELTSEMQKYNDYKDGKTKDPYIFVEPQRADVEKTIAEITKNLPTATYTVPNNDGSKSQVRQVKFGPGESYETVADLRLASDPEIKWQIENGYKSSKLIQTMYPKGPGQFLAARLRQAADSYNVQSDVGTSNKTHPYPNYYDDIFKPMQKMDPNAEYQVLGPSNPNAIVLTTGGDKKGNVPIRAGGEDFNVVTGQNNSDGVPIVSNVHVRYGMTVIQTYEPVNVKGVLKTNAFVNIQVPLGDEQLTDKGRSEYYDVESGQLIGKDQLYGTASPNEVQIADWKKRITDNKSKAQQVGLKYKEAGLRPSNTATTGSNFTTGAAGLKGMQQFEGTILMDMHLDGPSVRAYQERFNTPGKMDEWGSAFNITNMLNQNVDNPEAFIALSKSNPTEASQVVTQQLMKDPEFVAAKGVVSQDPTKPWIYKIQSPGVKGTYHYNVRTKNYE